MSTRRRQVPVIDGQVYIASTDTLPREFIEGIAVNTGCWLAAQGMEVEPKRVLETCLRHFDDPLCDALVAQMDEAGIDQAVLMAADFTYAFRSMKLTIAEVYERHRAVLERHPGRFYVMAGVDPRWGRDGLDLFERAVVRYGFHGLKLYPPCGYSPSEESLWPYYELCRAHGLPVSVHTGGTAPAMQLDLGFPRLTDRAARTFGDVSFILSHASTCYSDESAMMCSARPNVYLEVSGFASQPRARLNDLFDQGVSHKIIFATDWPSFRGQGPQATFVRAMKDEHGPLQRMRPFEVDRFWGGTMLSLLPSGAVAGRSRESSRA